MEFISGEILRKVRSRYFVVYWSFIFILAAIVLLFVADLYKIITEKFYGFNDAFQKKLFLLIFFSVAFYLLKRRLDLTAYIFNNYLVVQIITKSDFQFELVTLNENSYVFSFDTPVVVSKKWDQASAFFIYRTFINWGGDVREIFRFQVKESKFYIIPEFFEAQEDIYAFLKRFQNTDAINK